MSQAADQRVDAQLPFFFGGLISRGGLSNWVIFFHPDEIVMIDVGVKPSILAGAKIGIIAQFGLPGYAAFGRPVYGPALREGESLDGLRVTLQATAKDVQVMRDQDLLGIRLHFTAMAHELYISGVDGSERKFGLMDRAGADPATESLARRFGSRFQTTSTPVFAFFKLHAPFLMR